MQLSSDRNLLALLMSLGLHASLLISLVAAPTPPVAALPNSVAMPGNAIEVEAPTPDLAAAPAASPETPTPEAAPKPTPVDVRSLPAESETVVPVPAPKPKAPPRKPKPPPPSRAASPASPGAETATNASPSSGTFGQEGLAPGVRRLGYAFTRAIPAATPADAAWRELPSGHVGTIRIELEVDENNRLGALKRWQGRPGEPPAPAVLERLVERTLILLRAGQFALSGSNQPGSERLVIDVYLRDEAGEEDAGDTVVQKRFEGASPGHPGSAYFRYGTGRAFQAKVTVASSGK